MTSTYRNWNGGCETITRTGKRAGMKCNGRFYRTKTVNGKEIMSCYMHRDGFHQDVENEESFYEDGDDDEINESDFSFIAPEDDGTVVVNGRVFGETNPETETETTSSETEDLLTRERENHDKYELPYINLVSDEENESLYETEDAEEDAEGDEDEYYEKFAKEQQKSRNLEVLLIQERNKVEEYKKIITESISETDDEKLKVLRLKNKVSQLKKQFMEFFAEFEDIIECVNP